MVKISEQTINFIKNAEGFREKAYRHKAYEKDGTWKGRWEPWTVGWGFTFDEQGKPITATSTMSRERADKFLVIQLQKRAEEIMKTLPGVVLNDNQMSALVSLHHNIGPGHWSTSSVRRYLLKGDKPKAADAFLLWKRGNTANDLLSRREKERALFLKPATK
jgi:GH24 family phage-related lysozyme (muramidase)